jgi:hypothetical protein
MNGALPPLPHIRPCRGIWGTRTTFCGLNMIRDQTSWLTRLLRIREAPGSNLGPETGYPEFLWFSQYYQENAGLVPVRPRPLPSASFPNH